MNDSTFSDTIILEVARFHPERDAEPSYQNFEVPLRADWMVLDALNYVKDQLDGSLAFRWSCRMGICGSCGMMVNGVPQLTCETLLINFAPGPVRIAPLDHFPVIKDLVIEMDDFLGKLQKVRPWIVRKDDFVPKREFLQTPRQLEAYKQFSLCINCMLCYAACPVYGLDPSFTGPAALALAERYNLDSRDQGSVERTDVLSQHDGIWDCTVIGECSVVCPKHVDPSLAIQQYKLGATGDWFKTWLMPWGNK
jgi:fumarate reductase iron-sulfur subunit